MKRFLLITLFSSLLFVGCGSVEEVIPSQYNDVQSEQTIDDFINEMKSSDEYKNGGSLDRRSLSTAYFRKMQKAGLVLQFSYNADDKIVTYTDREGNTGEVDLNN